MLCLVLLTRSEIRLCLFQLRADAIETLQKVVADLGKSDVTKVQPHLPALMRFLNKLLVDPNFKISLTAIQIFGTFVDKAGDNIKPHVANVMPSLVEKLGDSKSAVRTTDIKVTSPFHTRYWRLFAGSTRPLSPDVGALPSKPSRVTHSGLVFSPTAP